MKKIGCGLIFLATACGGGAAQEPSKTPANVETKPVSSSSEPGGAPKANAWALPEGPRDATTPPVTNPPAAPLQLDEWKAVSKVKGVPAPAASCPKAKDAKTDEDVVKAATAATPECTDVVVDPVLSKRTEVKDVTGHTLIALSLGGKLARMAAPKDMPVLKDTSSKAKVMAFINGPFKEWYVTQHGAIDSLAKAGSLVPPPGRAIVAVEAGMADMRLADQMRSAPIPAEWAKDAELKRAYEGALEDAMNPIKNRGRDAALVGLTDYGNAQTANEPRVDRARVLLSKLYGGRRIDALDNLIVPNAPPRFELGRKYWRRVDFVESAYAVSEKKDDDGKLALATFLALAKGPDGAKQLMQAPTPGVLGLDHTEALDELAAAGGKNAGQAAFNAAYLRSLCVPEGAKASPYLADVAARAKKAESLLTDADAKKKAATLAADSEAASKATK